MGYADAIEMLTDKNAVLAVLLYLIAFAVLLVLTAQAVKAGKELFGRKKEAAPEPQEDALGTHCRESEERFRDGERHIRENRNDIMDLKEGQRVLCNGMYEVLGHLLHNGNKDAMEKASGELFKYLNS